MFFLIEFFLLSFSLVSFFLLFARGRKFLLSLFFSVPSFCLANIAAFVTLYHKAKSTPFATFTKISHFGKWVSFSLSFVAIFAAALLFCALLIFVGRINFGLAAQKQSLAQKTVLVAASAVVLVPAFVFLYGTFWAKGRFNMTSTDAVFYSLGNETGGMDQKIASEAAVLRLLVGLSVTFCVAGFLFLARAARVNSITFFYSGASKTEAQEEKSLCPKNFCPKIIFRQFSLQVPTALFLSSLIFSAAVLLWAAHELRWGSYGRLLAVNFGKDRKSDFIEQEFVPVLHENIKFPEKKKNLLFIFAESLESSYASQEAGGVFEENNIPLLTKIASENLSFSHNGALGGGKDLDGTRWTVAAMLAKFAGVPYNLPLSSKNDELFLPAAVTLTDILARNGYRQRFVFGSKKYFARRDKLLETHGGVEIHDIDWYKKNGFLPEEYQVFWGFEDSKLFEFVKLELSDLAANKEATGEPFMLGFLTVDTHMPAGFVCPLCRQESDWQLKDVVRCADRQLAGFLDWAKTQSWYADTALVIVGDHLFMTGDNTNFFENSSRAEIIAGKKKAGPQGVKSQRRWLNIFINAEPQKIGARIPAECENQAAAGKTESLGEAFLTDVFHGRQFCSFDIFPTTLSALGCQIKDDRLAFGTDLFSGQKTLCERYDDETIGFETMRKKW